MIWIFQLFLPLVIAVGLFFAIYVLSDIVAGFLSDLADGFGNEF